MIIALTAFALPQPVTREEAHAIFVGTAPKYRDVPGLFSKHYVLAEDGRSVGGVYLWNSKREAQALYTDAWRAFVRQTYGSEPTVTYFDCPLVVDNVAHETRSLLQAG